MILYFYFVLINLINDNKNIYYHNNNVYLGGFLSILFNLIIKIIIFSIKRDHKSIFRFASITF